MRFIKRKPIVACDIEVSPNAFLIGFKSNDKRKLLQFGVYGENESLSQDDKKRIKSLLLKYAIVTFNGQKYDMPVILRAIQQKVTCKKLFEMSKHMIDKNIIGWLTMKNYNINPLPGLVHIDLIEPAPGVMVSLKMYGARLHSKKLQDLPYEYDKHLTRSEYDVWVKYNENDLDTTLDLYNKISASIDHRYEMSDKYQLDLMSKGDAQIAEAVIVQELKNKGVRAAAPKYKPGYTFMYEAPECIKFESQELNELFEKIKSENFELNKGGSPQLPKWLSKPIQIGETKYKFGLGGIHSQEKKLVVESNKNMVMRNADVGSYYPRMLIEFGFYPKNIGKAFLDVYSKIFWDRNHPTKGSKVLGKKVESDTGKLMLNGPFGKLGSKWSKLYAPEMMIQITITGQLLLIMLIEQLELAGISVKSANTDGIEYYCPRNRVDEIESLIYDWELETGMLMEHGQYNALYARDVNNYVATYNNYAKTVGAYGKPTPKKNAEYYIVFDAIQQYLLENKDIYETIHECENITQFLICRNVSGGAIFREEYLGKVVRWYYSTDGETIRYKKNNNKVPKSDNAMPLMDLCDELPEDLDKDYYVDLAIKHLSDIGVEYASL